MDENNPEIQELKYGEEAVALAETAEELSEKKNRQKHIPDSETIEYYPVVGAERKDNKIEFTIVLGTDVKRTVEVDWPEDVSDTDEELVRLSEDEGFDVDLSDIEELPIYTDGDRFEVVIPERPSKQSWMYQKMQFMFSTTLDKSGYSTKVVERIRPAVLFVSSILSFIIASGLYSLISPVTTSDVTLIPFSLSLIVFSMIFVFAGLGMVFGIESVGRFRGIQ